MASLMRQINVISRCGAAFRAEHLRAIGLGAPHHSYILAVCRTPGITQEELARHIYVDKSCVARRVAQLEADGFVTRRPCAQDRRAVGVYPTQKALDALPEVRRVIGEWNAQITQDLTEAERAQLAEMIEKLARRAREYYEDREVPL